MFQEQRKKNNSREEWRVVDSGFSSKLAEKGRSPHVFVVGTDSLTESADSPSNIDSEKISRSDSKSVNVIGHGNRFELLFDIDEEVLVNVIDYASGEESLPRLVCIDKKNAGSVADLVRSYPASPETPYIQGLTVQFFDDAHNVLADLPHSSDIAPNGAAILFSASNDKRERSVFNNMGEASSVAGVYGDLGPGIRTSVNAEILNAEIVYPQHFEDISAGAGSSEFEVVLPVAATSKDIFNHLEGCSKGERFVDDGITWPIAGLEGEGCISDVKKVGFASVDVLVTSEPHSLVQIAELGDGKECINGPAISDEVSGIGIYTEVVKAMPEPADHIVPTSKTTDCLVLNQNLLEEKRQAGLVNLFEEEGGCVVEPNLPNLIIPNRSIVGLVGALPSSSIAKSDSHVSSVSGKLKGKASGFGLKGFLGGRGRASLSINQIISNLDCKEADSEREEKRFEDEELDSNFD